MGATNELDSRYVVVENGNTIEDNSVNEHCRTGDHSEQSSLGSGIMDDANVLTTSSPMTSRSPTTTPLRTSESENEEKQTSPGLSSNDSNDAGSSEIRCSKQISIDSTDQVFTCDTNFNLTKDEVQLLAKLELQNRILESDTKSLNSLSGASTGHSRRSSDTSQISVTSGASHPSSLTTGADESGDGAASSDTEENVWPLWGKIVNDWDTFKKKQSVQLKELVRKGVPHHFRGIVWQLLCNAQNASVREQYAEFIKSSSPCEKVIRRDIARTYPEHEFFKEKDGLGQESLFNVMKAFSLHDREVGYCQGSAFIVGLLLMQMPEEDAFAVLVKLMEEYRLREMFKPSMAELGLCMFKLECIVQEQLPELHVHFQSQNFYTSMYASSWFLTLFTTALPIHIACRIMDVFLLEGMEMIFRIAIAILQVSKEELLTLDMEGMLKYFQKEMPAKCETDPDYLICLAGQVKYNAKQMKKLDKDYTAVKTKEQEEMVELRRLRHENRLLRDRIEYLEAECSKLADRLIQDQVIRAQESEEVFALKRELSAVRLAEEDTRQRLLESKELITSLKTGQQAPSLSERAALDVIDALQQELVAVKLREAETHVTVKDFRDRIQELEDDNKKLRQVTPDSTVAHLQEEMMAAKLREAEATFGMKDLKQKVFELELEFKKMKSQPKEESPPPIISSFPLSPLTARKREQVRNNINQLQEDLMTVRFREATAVAELKEARQRTMELESQDQVTSNQLKRQGTELRKLGQKHEDSESMSKKLKQNLQDEKRRYTDLESKMKEDLMMTRIREVELTQQSAELKQKISSLECSNQELLVAGQIQHGEENVEIRAMQDKISELKVELMRLKIRNDNLSSKSTSTMHNGTTICNGNS